ncbi:MAG TPA: S8 family serine peptidase [Candidatus Limnocylindrales bacterium]
MLGLNGPGMVDLAVELEGQPVAVAAGDALGAGTGLTDTQKGSLRQGLERRQPAVEAGLRSLGARIEARYTDVFNGFRIRVPRASVERIASLPGVTHLYTVPLHTPTNTTTDDFLNADRTWGQTGFTGAGIKIAIIDSGINYNHVDFGGAGQAAFNANNGTVIEPGTFPTAKVVKGYDFVGDAYDGDNTPHPDPDPLDCKAADAEIVQHGTHVAGTAAGFGVKANGQTYAGSYNANTLSSTAFSVGPGVAPRAKLMAYRVFGCSGQTRVVTDAIERAVQDGADVINISLGTDLGSPEDLDAVAANNAALAGVTVVASAGNSGRSAYEVGSPAVATRAIAVGAIDAVRDFPGATIDLATQPNVDAINANEAALPVTGVVHRFADDPSTEADPDTGVGGENLGCDAGSYAYNHFLAGQIAVVDRGGCARVDKAKVGQLQGAAAVVMINTFAGLPPLERAIAGVSIPFIGVSTADAGLLETDDGTSATISATGRISNPSFKHAAEFTSAGPRRLDLMIKPDVVAPGVAVFSADGSTGSSGKSLSGTSMASPAVAGVAALVNEAHPGWSPAQIKAAIVSTAAPNQVDPYQIVQSGAGVAAPRRAVDTKAYATTEPGSSSLTFGYHDMTDVQGSTVAYRQTRQLTIHNTSNASIKYTLTNAFNTSSLGLTVALSPTSVNVPAGTTRTVEVTLAMTETAAAALDDVAPFHSPAIAVDEFGQLYTPMSAVAGVILATPTAEGTGIYPLRIPWLVAPRGDSDVKDVAGSRAAYVNDGNLRRSTVEVRNRGLHAGIMDVYQWGIDDPNDGLAGIDLRAAGVQSIDPAVCDSGAPAKDRCLVFAINTWGRWSNAAENEFDVNIDTNGDGQADFAVIGVDLGLVFDTLFGLEGSVIFDLRTDEIINLYFATAPPNGSTVLLPVLASDLGLAKSDDRNFTYTVASFNTYDDVPRTDTMGTTKPGHFNAFKPVLSNGDFVALDPGASSVLNLSVDASRYAPNKGMLGWMVVTLEDANGKAQADTLAVGTVPS